MKSKNPGIQIDEKKRDSVEVVMADGTILSGPRYTPVGDFMKVYQNPEAPLIVGAIVNNNLRELTYPLSSDATVSPINMSDSDGARIYRRSLTFLLEVAFLEHKLRLLNYRHGNDLVLYELKGKRDYHHGYMVPSTGYLKLFDLHLVGSGFVLRFPRRHAPDTLSPMKSYPSLLSTFRQYGDWLEKLGIQSVGALNDAIGEGRAAEVILVSEALHVQQVSSIANAIKKEREKIHVILIAGPTSSGKTTFSKRLTIQLLTEGISPFALEMDNYFVNREDTPKDSSGHYDFEHLDALNRSMLNNHLEKLIKGERVQLRYYDFHEGINKPGEEVQLEPGQIIILEGIHGLNPKLLEGFPPEHTFRIYVSCLTQLNLDRHNRISTTDTRELRRIVRDARDRGYTAQQTISQWENVRRGEKRHIFPYQENADVMFNSALVYELTALKPLVEPLLRQVPYGTLEFIEAKRLFKFLQWFVPIDPNLIPDNSILREFIGNSILKNFKIWQHRS